MTFTDSAHSETVTITNGSDADCWSIATFSSSDGVSKTAQFGKGSTNVELTYANPVAFTGATESDAGTMGLVPAPSKYEKDYILSATAEWVEKPFTLVESGEVEARGTLIIGTKDSNGDPRYGIYLLHLLDFLQEASLSMPIVIVHGFGASISVQDSQRWAFGNIACLNSVLTSTDDSGNPCVKFTSYSEDTVDYKLYKIMDWR